MANTIEIKITAENQAGPALADVSTGLQNVESSAAAVPSTMGSVIGSFTEFKSALSLVSGALDTAAAAFDATVGAYLQWGGMVDDISAITGDSAEDVSGLAGAMSLLGISTDVLNPILRYFSMNADKVAVALEKAGIEAHNADGSMRGFMDVLPDISDLFNELPAGPERTGLMMDLMGRQATELFDILEKGSIGIKELTNDAADLGMVLDEKAAQAAENLSQSMERVNTQLAQTKRNIGESVLPAVESATTSLAGLTGNALSLGDKFQLVGATLLDLFNPQMHAADRATADVTARMIAAREAAEDLRATSDYTGLAAYNAAKNTFDWSTANQGVIESGSALAAVIGSVTAPSMELLALDTAAADLAAQNLIMTLDAMTLKAGGMTIQAELMGQKIDEAMQRAIDKGPLTLTELNSLATGLLNDTEKALALGAALPIATLDTMGQSIDNVTGLLATMDLPPDVKAALLAFLDTATANLARLRDMANEAAGSINTIAPPSGGGGAPIAMQSGGIVPGPIGAPVPAILHGGEIVTNPYEAGGKTVNYSPTYNFGAADAGTVHALQRRELTEAAVFSGS